jgi:hypothetical protein
MMQLTYEQIHKLAIDTVNDHGLGLVNELLKGDNFDGGNLVALLELFAARLQEAAKP